MCFRLTLDERRMLDAAAERSGRSLSDYARAALLAARPSRKAKTPSIESTLLARVLAKLGVVATLLQEIAESLRGREAKVALMPSVERDLARNLTTLAHCRSLLLRALRRKGGPT